MAGKQASIFSPTDELAQVIGEELAGHFIAHRKALKKPMTAFAAQLMAKKLRTMPDPVAAVEQSILKGWCDVFEVKNFTGFPRDRPTGVAAEREKLRQEIENEQHRGIQGQAIEDSRHAGGLFELDWERPHRAH